MVRIIEIDESDDSLERLNLEDYNSGDFKEYLSDDDIDATLATMTTMTTIEIKTNVHTDPRATSPSITVTVTVKMDDDNNNDMERRRIRNHKRAIHRHCVAKRYQDQNYDSYDYSNHGLRNDTNIGRDARNVIISKKHEKEKVEAYSPTSNYHMPKDHSREPRKRPHPNIGHQHNSAPSTSYGPQNKKANTTQERFKQALRKCYP